MNRTWLLALIFALFGGAAWYVLSKKDTGGSRASWDMDFAVQSSSDVQKIFIADRTGQTATLERQKDGTWIYNGKFKARPSAVESLMEALTKINVNFVPPKSAESTMVKNLAADAVKVEIWNAAGERLKCYYVGGVTGDERGTYAIMEGAEQPYVVHIPGFIGQIRVRYFLGDDNWRDRSVFAEKPEEIQSIVLDYPMQKFQSFRLEKSGEAQYEVTPLHPELPRSTKPMRKGVAEAYVLQFEKLGAEAFDTQNPMRDSITSTPPFVKVSLKKTDGTEKSVRFYPFAIEKRGDNQEDYVHRFFADASWGDFYLTQDVVFGKIFRGYSFFFEGGGQAGAGQDLKK